MWGLSVYIRFMNHQLDQEFATSSELNYAENGTRILHNLIDQVMGYVLIQAFIIGLLFIPATQQWMYIQIESEASYNFNFVFISIGIYWLFFFLQEAYWDGRTLGKWMTGCKVVMQNGEPVTKKAIALRSIARFIPFDALTIFNGTILHDRLAKTEVIKL
jgi:uncharacterized RDD family membrane protein YckC